MIKLLAIYILVSIIYSIISAVDSYFVWKKKVKEKPEMNAGLQAFKGMAKGFWDMFIDKKTASGRRNRWILAYAGFILFPILIICCPLFFPLSVISIFYNIIFFKKIQKKKKDMEESKKKSEEWLENEGRKFPGSFPDSVPQFEEVIIEEPPVREIRYEG